MNSDHRNSYNIVFLVDDRHDPIHTHPDVPKEQYYRAVSHSVLRLLSNFNSEVLEDSKYLQWSFRCLGKNKWYSSNKQIFRDFDLSSFEEFEKELLLMLDRCDSSENKSIENEMYTFETLQNTLIEVLHNFQWDRPCIQSPVKQNRNRLRKSLQKSESSTSDQLGQQHNFLFYICPCPYSTTSISELAGDVCDTSDKLLNEILPDRLFREFFTLRKISLYWIDTTYTDRIKCDTSGKKLLNTCLKLVSGGVIPLGSLVTKTFHNSSLLVDSCIYPNFPLNGVFKFENDLDGLLREDALSLSYVKDSVTIDLCNVRLRKVNSNTDVTHISAVAESIKTLDAVSNVGTRSNIISCELRTKSESTGTISVDSKHKKDNKSLVIRGILSDGRVPLFLLNDRVAYIVYSNDQQNESAWSGLLCKLYTLKGQLALTVGSGCTWFILQPISSKSAVLTQVISKYTLITDKICSFGNSGIPVGSKPLLDTLENVAKICSLPSSLNVQNSERTKIDSSLGLASEFNPAFLENSNVSSSRGKCFCALYEIVKKNKETNDYASEEIQILKKLRKSYIKKKSKRLNVVENEHLRRSPRKHSGPTEVSRRVSPRKKKLDRQRSFQHARSSTAPSRTDFILKRSKEVQSTSVSEVVNEVKTTKATKEKDPSLTQQTTQIQDVNTEIELLEYMTKIYDKGLEGHMAPLTSVHNCITMATHFIKCQGHDGPRDKIRDLFTLHFLLDNSTIKAKYIGQEDPLSKERLLNEYQLQILFNMELDCLVSDKLTEDEIETRVNKLAQMLRAMSFLKDPSFLSSYLNSVLLESYAETLPMLLGKLYDELLQPIPQQLEGLFSPELDSTEPKSVTVLNPLSSVSLQSVQDSPNRVLRERKLKRCSSSTFNIPQRRLSIELPKKFVKDKKIKNNAKCRSSTKKKPARSKPSKDPAPGSATKVRRNLFMGGEENKQTSLHRRKSVAVMQNVSTPRRSGKAGRSQFTPKQPRAAHHKLKTKLVAETPAHKQKGKLMWRKQEQERRRSHTQSEIAVVKESPDKAISKSGAPTHCKPGALSHVRSNTNPGGGKATLGIQQQRRSFYGDVSKDRMLKIEKLEARMTKSRLLSPDWKDKQGSIYQGLSRSLSQTSEASPKRIKPKMLFAGLSSPSPRKTPVRRILNTPVKGSPRRLLHTPVKGGTPQKLLLSPAANLTPVKMRGSLFAPDTPGRNTRSQTAPTTPGRQTPGRTLAVDTPPKLGLMTGADTPSKNTRLRTLFSPPEQQPLPGKHMTVPRVSMATRRLDTSVFSDENTMQVLLSSGRLSHDSPVRTSSRLHNGASPLKSALKPRLDFSNILSQNSDSQDNEDPFAIRFDGSSSRPGNNSVSDVTNSASQSFGKQLLSPVKSGDDTHSNSLRRKRKQLSSPVKHGEDTHGSVKRRCVTRTVTNDVGIFPLSPNQNMASSCSDIFASSHNSSAKFTSYNSPAKSYNSPAKSYNSPAKSYNSPTKSYNSPAKASISVTKRLNSPSKKTKSPTKTHSLPSNISPTKKTSDISNDSVSQKADGSRAPCSPVNSDNDANSPVFTSPYASKQVTESPVFASPYSSKTRVSSVSDGVLTNTPQGPDKTNTPKCNKCGTPGHAKCTPKGYQGKCTPTGSHGNKYSPLSMRGLNQLIHSPVISVGASKSGQHKGGGMGSSGAGQEASGGERTSGRTSRRSLYRTTTAKPL